MKQVLNSSYKYLLFCLKPLPLLSKMDTLGGSKLVFEIFSTLLADLVPRVLFVTRQM